MKQLKSYITEAIKDTDKGIIDMLNFFAKNSSGYQKDLFMKKAKDANSVDVVPLSEVFTKKEIAEIKKRVRPIPKSCYENAWKLCDRFEYEGNHEILYCEGYMNFKGLPIEHAFNKVDGKYVDVRGVMNSEQEVLDEFDYGPELETQIIKMVAQCYNADEATLSVDSEFGKDISGTSVMMVGLVSEIENELDAMIQLSDAAACKTIGNLVDKVEEEL